MEIKIQVKGRIFSLSFGYETKWFSGLSFITITELWCGGDMEIDYDKLIWRS